MCHIEKQAGLLLHQAKKIVQSRHTSTFCFLAETREHSVLLIPRFRNESVRTGGPAQVCRNRSMLFWELWQAYSRWRHVEHQEVVMRKESWEGEQVEGDRMSETCLWITIIHISSWVYDVTEQISNKSYSVYLFKLKHKTHLGWMTKKNPNGLTWKKLNNRQ